jgi:hypothetical protein
MVRVNLLRQFGSIVDPLGHFWVSVGSVLGLCWVIVGSFAMFKDVFEGLFINQLCLKVVINRL